MMHKNLVKAVFVVDHAPSHANAILDRLRAPAGEPQIKSFTHDIDEATLSFLQRAENIEINGEKYIIASIDLAFKSITTFEVVSGAVLKIDSATVHLASNE